MDEYMSDSPEPAEAPEATPMPEEQPDDGPKTALIPISFLDGEEAQPGAVITLTVKKVYDDQVEVIRGDARKSEATGEAVPASDYDEVMG